MTDAPKPDTSRESVEKLATPEGFEDVASAFYAETGMMAPGKDYPAALDPPDRETRQQEWRGFLRHRRQTRDQAKDRTLLALLDRAEKAEAALASASGYAASRWKQADDWRAKYTHMALKHDTLEAEIDELKRRLEEYERQYAATGRIVKTRMRPPLVIDDD